MVSTDILPTTHAPMKAECMYHGVVRTKVVQCSVTVHLAEA
jgi:hypothetical protein